MARVILRLHHPMRRQQLLHWIHEESELSDETPPERQGRTIHENAQTPKACLHKGIQLNSRSHEKREADKEAEPSPETRARKISGSPQTAQEKS